MTARASAALILLALCAASAVACGTPPSSTATLPAVIEPSQRVTVPADVSTFGNAGADGTVMIGLEDGTVALWNGRDASPTLLRKHAAPVIAIRAERSGAELLSVSEKGDVSRTDVKTGATSPVSHMDFSGLDLTAAAFSSDGTSLGVGTGLGPIVIFDVATAAKRHTLTGHRGEINNVAFRTGSQTMASAAADADVRLWDISAGREIRTFDNDMTSIDIAFSPSNGMLAWGGTNRRVSLREPSSWDETGTFAVAAPWFVSALAWSPDGARLAVGALDERSLANGEIQIVDPATRPNVQKVTTLSTGGKPAGWIAFAASDLVAAVVGDRELAAWQLRAAK